MMYRGPFFKSFSSIKWDDFQNNIIREIADEIGKCKDDYILNVNEDEYIAYLVDKYTIDPLKIVEDSEEVGTPTEFREDLSQYDNSYTYIKYGGYRVGYSIHISYTYTGNGILFEVRPNPCSLTSYEISVDKYLSKVAFIIKVFSYGVDEFQREKEQAFKSAFTNIKNVNSCVTLHNKSLNDIVRQKFIMVKQNRLAKTNFFAAIKVKKTTDAPSTYGVPVIKKKDIAKPKCPESKAFFPEPSLDISTYKEIITEINQLGRSMERKPSLYLNKDEEALRDMFVMMLETRFDGTTATSETFNHCGKTDILLKNTSDSSNLFIAECKFWHGKKHFLEAINQLFDRYLTWRDSKTAVIVFVNGTDFSNVLNTIKDSIVTHPYYVRFNEKHSDTSLNYIFRLPQDANKEVYLEVIAFNFDKNKEDL